MGKELPDCLKNFPYRCAYFGSKMITINIHYGVAFFIYDDNLNAILSFYPHRFNMNKKTIALLSAQINNNFNLIKRSFEKNEYGNHSLEYMFSINKLEDLIKAAEIFNSFFMISDLSL